MKTVIIIATLIFIFFTDIQGAQMAVQLETRQIIDVLTVEKNKIIIVPHASFSHFFKEQKIILEYEEDIDLSCLDASIVSIPFIMIAAPMVWVTGACYTVDSMDEELYISLQKIKIIFKHFFPEIDWKGEIVPKTLIQNKRRGATTFKTAALYSGGLDSTALAFAHNQDNPLLITLRGIDIPFKEDERWGKIKMFCTNFAQSQRLTNTFISSNVCSAINYAFLNNLPGKLTKWWWWDNILASMGFVALTAPLLAYRGCDTLLFASSNTIDFPFTLQNHPLIDNNLAFAGIRVHNEQNDLTRPGKVALICSRAKQLKQAIPRLRVCWQDSTGGNCGKCEKCLRTINVVIAHEGEIHAFGFDMDIEEAMARSKEFIESTLATADNGIIWEWITIQKDIQKNRRYAPKVQSYVDWLSALPLDRFYNKAAMHHKTFLVELWILGQRGPNQLSQLQSLLHKK